MSIYDNANKNGWRTWAWDYIAKHVGPGVRNPVVLVMCGDTTKDIDEANARGLDVVGVDLDIANVKRFRAAGAIAVQADVHDAAEYLQPDGMILDYTGEFMNRGLTLPGIGVPCIVNSLRGRGASKDRKAMNSFAFDCRDFIKASGESMPDKSRARTMLLNRILAYAAHCLGPYEFWNDNDVEWIHDFLSPMVLRAEKVVSCTYDSSVGTLRYDSLAFVSQLKFHSAPTISPQLVAAKALLTKKRRRGWPSWRGRRAGLAYKESQSNAVALRESLCAINQQFERFRKEAGPDFQIRNGLSV